MRGRPLAAATLGGSLLVLMAAARAADGDGSELPPGADRALIYGQCRTCHDLQYLIESKGIPRNAWNDVIDSMEQYGLRLPLDKRARILDYLATYLGPNPPPASSGGVSLRSSEADGPAIFKEQCASCHQEDGKGTDGQFPPLAGNRDLLLSENYPARIVLFGLKGKIVVNGKEFNAEMPPFNVLSDQQIARVVTYIRKAWGNSTVNSRHLSETGPATVKQLRFDRNVTPDQNYAWRETLKAEEMR